MIFGIFTLIVALAISAIAAYYSIAGLTSIFAAAVVPIIIMGAALEIGKITAAVWLKLNWSRAKWTYKLYLVPAVTVLMLLTSMGIFGFLSKAHSDQTLVTGDSAATLALFDEKIKVQRENIDTARRALAQMDAQVNERLSRGTSEQGVERAALLRRQQQQERTKLLKDVSDAQAAIQKLNEERAPVAANFRKVEAEVGPIKYIAALIYGPNPDANLLEKAVSWMIIVIVAVFDPLALVLILAAQQSIKWARDNPKSKIKQEPTEQKILSEPEPIVPSQTDQTTFDVNNYPYLSKPWVSVPTSSSTNWVWTSKVDEPQDTLPKKIKKAKTIKNDEPVQPSSPIDEVTQPDPQPPTEEFKVKKVEGDYYEVNDKKYSKDVFQYMYPDLYRRVNLQADNINTSRAARSTFGTEFPKDAQVADFFIRVDQVPNRVYKYNGSKWLEVDKNKTDAYAYDDKYIDYLVENLQKGIYELDQLTAAEQDLVAEKLQKAQNGKT